MYVPNRHPPAKQITTTVQNRLENGMSRPRMGSKEMHKNAWYWNGFLFSIPMRERCFLSKQTYRIVSRGGLDTAALIICTVRYSSTRTCCASSRHLPGLQVDLWPSLQCLTALEYEYHIGCAAVARKKIPVGGREEAHNERGRDGRAEHRPPQAGRRAAEINPHQPAHLARPRKHIVSYVQLQYLTAIE